MPVLILYLLKLSVSLAIVWLFYHVFLRKLTFYSLNRWYLLGYSILSFLIPFINIGLFFNNDPVAQPVVVRYIPVLWDFKAAPAAPVIRTWDLVLIAVCSGALFLVLRFAVRWAALRRLRAEARLLSDDGLRIYQVDRSITPFSFGRSIYINGQQHSADELDAIIRHEFVHVRQKHTIDIMLMELFCVINWYNPFIWLIRRDVRQNLEFIADNGVVNSGCDKKSYQYHLLQVAGNSRYCLANNFNFSSLKKRIIMMNKVKTARLHLVKFLFIVPLLSVLLVAFRSADTNKGGAMTGGVTQGQLHMAIDPGAAGQDGTSRTVQERGVARVPVNRRDTTPLKIAGVVKLRQVNDNKPLILVDGKTMPADWDMNSLPADEIQSVEVLKDEKATRIFGQAGVNGVVAILTKVGAAALPVKKPTDKVEVTIVGVQSKAVNDTALPKTLTLHLAPPPSPAAKPTTTISVTPASAASPASAVSPADAPTPAPKLQKVTVVGYANMKPAGSKDAKPEVVIVQGVKSRSVDTASTNIHLDLIYIVDGVEKSREEIGKINPSDISSMDVHKDDAETKKYGDKAKNGLIYITLKKDASKK